VTGRPKPLLFSIRRRFHKKIFENEIAFATLKRSATTAARYFAVAGCRFSLHPNDFVQSIAVRAVEFSGLIGRRHHTEPVSPRHLQMASLAEADRPHRGWRQIEVTPADKGTAIIDARRHAALVADAD
jgi:hypothetical protein